MVINSREMPLCSRQEFPMLYERESTKSDSVPYASTRMETALTVSDARQVAFQFVREGLNCELRQQLVFKKTHRS